MINKQLPEVWLRGPLSDMPAMLQPAAHALLQAREEIRVAMSGFDESLLCKHPGKHASVAFHLQHICGFIDRLLTYARGEQLSEEQLDYLAREGECEPGISGMQLVGAVWQAIDRAIAQYRDTDPASLTEFRGVGRQQLPSTVIGLLFHAAEHCMRHTGQLILTIAWVKAEGGQGDA